MPIPHCRQANTQLQADLQEQVIICCSIPGMLRMKSNAALRPFVCCVPELKQVLLGFI